MAIFMDSSGRLYSAELPKSAGDAEKPYVSRKLIRVLDDNNGMSMNEEEINLAIAALDRIPAVREEDLLI